MKSHKMNQATFDNFEKIDNMEGIRADFKFVVNYVFVHRWNIPFVTFFVVSIHFVVQDYQK